MTLRQLRKLAFFLLTLTLLYNVAEGVIAITAGVRADSVVLLAFGADSYLEVVAAGAVIRRLTFDDGEAAERAEGRVLRVIGWTFLLLAGAVVLQSIASLAHGRGASDSLLGLALLVASATVMPVLAVAKLWVAARAVLPVLAAEARETVACSYLSLTALAGVAATAILGWWWLDAVAALLMVPWLVKEGLERVKGDACFDGSHVCWCRTCWFGIRACTDLPATTGLIR